MKINSTFKLIIAIVVSELAGVIGSIFTAPSIPTWYATLPKPALNPPAWVFGPIWTTLFLLMGISAWLVWRQSGISQAGREIAALPAAPRNDKKIKISLGIFVGQLVLNTFWSIIFFGLHNPGAALVEIIFLWLVILTTIIAFSKISKFCILRISPSAIPVANKRYKCQ